MTTLPNGTWELDPSKTNVEVTVKNFVINTVVGTLKVESGSIVVADGAVTSVAVTAKADSYTSGNAKRDEHVRAADFLDADVHPTIEFAAVGAEASGTNYRLAGTTTVKGATAPLTLNVSGINVDGERATFTASGSVDRNAIGVDKLPGLMISNNIDLAITATATTAAK